MKKAKIVDKAGGGAPIESTDPSLNAPISRPAAPTNDGYWKGRDFAPPPGSRRARKAFKSHTDSKAAAPLGERRLIQQLASPDSQSIQERNDKSLELVEQLQEFEEFKKDILPSLQADLKKGLPAERIVEKYKALAAAKMVSLLNDKKLGHTAAKDILDRGLGKAVERKAIRHQFQDLDEAQLDSLISSRLKDIEHEDSDE